MSMNFPNQGEQQTREDAQLVSNTNTTNLHQENQNPNVGHLINLDHAYNYTTSTRTVSHHPESTSTTANNIHVNPFTYQPYTNNVPRTYQQSLLLLTYITRLLQ